MSRMIFCVVCLLTSSVALLPENARAQIVISEVAYDPAGSDDNKEWIELQNIGSASVDISKWSFSDGGSTKHALNLPPKNGGRGEMLVPAGGFVILADDARTFLGMYPGVATVIDTTMNLKNPTAGNPVSLALYDERKESVDTFAYVGGTVGKNSGDTAQRFGTSVAGASPTPGAPNVKAQARVSHAAAPVAIAKKTTTSRPTTKKASARAARKPVPEERSQGDSPVRSGTTSPVATQVAMAGSATPGTPSYWYAAALGLAIVGAGAAYVSGALKKDEWEIEDEGETV